MTGTAAIEPECRRRRSFRGSWRAQIPRQFVISPPKVFFLFPQDDIVGVLAFLAGGDDEEIVSTARQSSE